MVVKEDTAPAGEWRPPGRGAAATPEAKKAGRGNSRSRLAPEGGRIDAIRPLRVADYWAL
jgi:hypothetical protein